MMAKGVGGATAGVNGFLTGGWFADGVGGAAAGVNGFLTCSCVVELVVVASVEVFFTCRPSDRLLFTAGTALVVGVGSAERALRVAKGPAGGAEFSPDGQASELNEFGSVLLRRPGEALRQRFNVGVGTAAELTARAGVATVAPSMAFAERAMSLAFSHKPFFLLPSGGATA